MSEYLRVSRIRCREKVKTHVEITPEDETGSFSIVHVKTRDRPGLLTDIVRTLKDLNVNVISAEVGAFWFLLYLAGNALLLHWQNYLMCLGDCTVSAFNLGLCLRAFNCSGFSHSIGAV